jgi:transposase
MDVIHQRCAGIDISKADVKVCIRVPGPGTRRRTEVRTFTSMTGDLLAMRDWLMSEQVTLVGMEATGAYWKPIFYLLETQVECWLLNARHMKTVPGRKMSRTPSGSRNWSSTVSCDRVSFHPNPSDSYGI